MPTLWKTGRTPAQDRAARHRAVAAEERRRKAEVRARDLVCRFPGCGCRRLGLSTEVSHQTHKGIGGDPQLLRTTVESMLLLCRHRHREGRISIDRGTLRWEGLTPCGANGRIAWWIQVGVLGLRVPAPGWLELGQEVTRPDGAIVFVPVGSQTSALWADLARMVD